MFPLKSIFHSVSFFLLLVLFLSPASAARANPGILRAAPDGVTNGNCDSWANACTLQRALAVAVSGDEIWVKAGVHHPGSNRTDTFTLKNGVAIYGGFAGKENSRNQRNWQTNLTILSGDIDHNDTNTDGNNIAETWNDIEGNNAYHVVTSNGADSHTVLDGFFITAGQANGSSNPNNKGGGMYNASGSPGATLTNVTFSGNSATFGGGMYNYDSSPKLRNVVFRGNSATSYGGGMDNSSNSPELTNVVFSGNSATNYGGGMYNAISNPTLTNVTFSGNSATYGGGGMANFNSSSPKLTNVILWGNTAVSGPGIYNSSSTAVISYSNIQGCGSSSGFWVIACGTNGGGNIAGDPLFVDADGPDNIFGTPDDNLRLQLTSPAIDAGDNDATNLTGVTTDLDGRPRFVNIPTAPDTGSGTPPIVDMGAYEAQIPIIYLPLILR